MIVYHTTNPPDYSVNPFQGLLISARSGVCLRQMSIAVVISKFQRTCGVMDNK